MGENLNIYIPSFNRPEKCLETLRQLISQIGNNENVSITVLDNYSDVNYKEYFLKTNDVSKFIQDGVLDVIRNNLNVGMSANIMRCFEYSSIKKGWLWILSDDDDIKGNAIQIIKESILQTCKDVGFIKYSSNRLRHQNGFLIDNPKKLIEFISVNPKIRFNSYIFLTNLVYRIKSYKEAVSDSNDFNLTHVPHFILLNLAVKKNSYIKHNNNQLATYKRPKLGYSYGLFAGIQVGSIKPLVIDEVSLRDFHYVFQVHNDVKVAIDLYYELLSKNSIKKLGTYLYIYFSNLIFAKCHFRSILFIPISIVIITKPLREILISILSKSKYSSEMREIKKRYNIKN